MEHTHPAPKKRYSIKDFLPLIFAIGTVLLLTLISSAVRGDSSSMSLMLDMMGWFFLIFSGLKLLNWRGFVMAYQEYDVIAAKSKVYAQLYPLIELTLALLYLTRTQINIAAWVTLIIMVVGAAGVFRELRRGHAIRCACIGVVFKVPMTWVTLGEDLIMAVMAAVILFS